MSASTWIAIYLPLFIIFIIVLPQQRSLMKATLIRKKRKGVKIMTNEIIKKYIGSTCTISTGSFGANLVGRVINVTENWIEVETKRGIELINAEFIQVIKIMKVKD